MRQGKLAEVALPEQSTFTIKMYAVIRNADKMVVGVIPPDVSYNDAKKDVGSKYSLVKMTIENSPAKTGMYWNKSKFVERLENE